MTDPRTLLIHDKTGKPAEVGDEVVSFRGEKAQLAGSRPPTSPRSQGHVSVIIDGCSAPFEYYAGVYGLRWVAPQ